MASSNIIDAEKAVETRSKARLFFELNRLNHFPAGTDLLFWPCAWALAMASYNKSLPFNVFVFDFFLYIFASTLVHSAACVLNDILDRELDAQGLAMNWGFVVVWVYLVPDDKTYIVPAAFFAGTICWTLVYDTIYACQDRIDDIKAGNHSTAVLFGDFVKPILSFFAISFVAAIAFSGKLNNQGPVYYLVTVGGTALHLLWQLATLKTDVPADCWQKFKSNGDLGWIIFAGITADYLLKA
ncbi:hypothetical protein C0995_016400 [Termitomyces sp. Mi166|nr:hypothetical protein C0995_016400 [Termitomyces sp. Mi166\